jgi:quinol monooxygenase YgiN
LFAQENPPSSHVIIMGTIKVKEGREEDFRKAMHDATARTKSEDKGNVRYDFYNVSPMGRGGQTPGPATIIFIEEWQDQASAAAHQKWAGAVVQNVWRELADVQFVRLTPIESR